MITNSNGAPAAEASWIAASAAVPDVASEVFREPGEAYRAIVLAAGAV